MPTQLVCCPVCEGPSIEPSYRFTGARGAAWQIVRCDGCGLGFINPQPSWQELAPYYSTDYVPYGDSHGADGSDDAVLELARASGQLRHAPIRAGTRVLDLGCGGGWFLRTAGKLGAVVEGVEPSELAAAVARQSGLEVFHGTIDEYTKAHAQKRFDVITANHVLEHVQRPVEFLREAAKVLGGDGVIVVAVPNGACYAGRSLRGKWHSADLPRHVMQFTIPSLAECGCRAGLHVRSIGTYSLPSAVASSLRMWLRCRLMVPGRLSARLRAINSLAPRLANRMDAAGTGEAVIAHFEHPTNAQPPKSML